MLAVAPRLLRRVRMRVRVRVRMARYTRRVCVAVAGYTLAFISMLSVMLVGSLYASPSSSIYCIKAQSIDQSSGKARAATPTRRGEGEREREAGSSKQPGHAKRPRTQALARPWPQRSPEREQACGDY